MKRFLAALALGILLSSSASAQKTKPAKTNDVAELVTILKETKSPDAFVLALKLVVAHEPQFDGLLPLIVRRADELGLIKGIAVGKESHEQEIILELIETIVSAHAEAKATTAKKGALVVPELPQPSGPKQEAPFWTPPAYPVSHNFRIFDGLLGSEPKHKAEFPLRPRTKDSKDDVKVIVLTSCSPGGIPAEMIGVDRLLSTEIIPLLEKRCTENKENVTVLKSAPLDRYKRENPDWRSKHPKEIGEYFEADYLIDVEVRDISIYEKGTQRELMQGRATVQITAYNISKPLKEPSYSPVEMNFEFPKGRPVPVLEENPSTFRQRFIKRIAENVVLPFTAHTSDQKLMVE